MVELCELNINEWQSDIDEHVAELDFNSNSSSLSNNSLFISNDSLDFDKLHRHCYVKKNDYKLTFNDDSGQWTTSDHNLTNWGNIRCNETEKTNSLPELKTSNKSDLLRKFVERKSDYELYFANGKYFDINYNEINNNAFDRWNIHNNLSINPLSKPKRTFADFEKEDYQNDLHQRAPSLDFMAMKHKVPDLCEISSLFSSSLTVNDILLRIKDDGIISNDKLNITIEEGPDSGLGSSNYSNNGPLHIEDWPSLAILLTKSVVETCTFFKLNNRLLSASSLISNNNNNNIERINSNNNIKFGRYEACRTCFGIRKYLHPPLWAQPINVRNILCNCTNSEIFDRSYLSVRSQTSIINRLKLHSHELSIIGLPIYSEKRMLVEKVVEGVAELARTGNSSSLYSSLETLVADGLKDSLDLWQMIVKITGPGPATNHIFNFVKDLNNDECINNCRVLLFFEELLRLESVDCWIYYAVLKENILKDLYKDESFLLHANTSYRSLLFRLLENLEYLTFIKSDKKMNYKLLKASRIANDSRIPKSSSMPSRLPSFRPTRIPRLVTRPTLGRAIIYKKSFSFNHALATIDYDQPGMLRVSKGEPLYILTKRGPFARCCRVQPLYNRIFQGLLPVSILNHQ